MTAAAVVPPALAALADEPCENYTSGDCTQDPVRTPDNRYESRRYCWPCRIRHALPFPARPDVGPDPDPLAAAHPGYDILVNAKTRTPSAIEDRVTRQRWDVVPG